MPDHGRIFYRPTSMPVCGPSDLHGFECAQSQVSLLPLPNVLPLSPDLARSKGVVAGTGSQVLRKLLISIRVMALSRRRVYGRSL